ncbi:MAG TPA: chalcone isomerase family protein [Steroidobacteraceae bacterium]|nr:chalcone isomerase family protein [Steroidobacteraceae bacterium]
MKRLLLMMLVAAAALRPAVAATVDGIRVADSVQLGGATLALNGAGKRTRFFFNVYIAALYLPSRMSSAAAVLADPGPKRVSLTMMRHLSSGQFIDALHEAIAHNSTPAELAQMKPQIDALMAAMRATGGVNEGDLLTIDFLPDGTTRVGRNGRAQGGPIAGRNFQRALLDVWIGPIPVQADLKSTLLGG